MNYKVEIQPHCLEELVTIEASHYTEAVSKLVDYIQKMNQPRDRLTVKKGGEVYWLAHDDIYRLVIEDRIVRVKTQAAEFTTNLRLYQLKEILPEFFLQISQSEIINLNHLDHLQVTPNGLVKIIMKNGEGTYSSRRYLKLIKETIGL